MGDIPKNNFWVSGRTLTLETLPDAYILEFCITNKKAREDFDKAFPYLSEERQEYLTELVEKPPFVKTRFYIDPKIISDRRQAKVNTKGIHLPKSPRLRKLLKKRRQENEE